MMMFRRWAQAIGYMPKEPTAQRLAALEAQVAALRRLVRYTVEHSKNCPCHPEPTDYAMNLPTLDCICGLDEMVDAASTGDAEGLTVVAKRA